MTNQKAQRAKATSLADKYSSRDGGEPSNVITLATSSVELHVAEEIHVEVEKPYWPDGFYLEATGIH